MEGLLSREAFGHERRSPLDKLGVVLLILGICALMVGLFFGGGVAMAIAGAVVAMVGVVVLGMGKTPMY